MWKTQMMRFYSFETTFDFEYKIIDEIIVKAFGNSLNANIERHTTE